ncbi:hypothetical protein J2T08_002960 [Neorhizobium galegae]|nr:hypothetical protein [Neorhizobium galegae]
MSGFTDEEIAAERARRIADIRSLDNARKDALAEARTRDADTACLHCGSAMRSWEASDKENPLCDLCLHG